MSEKKNLDDSNIFSDELIKTLKNKKVENTTGEKLKRMFNGEPKNINPLTSIPESQMRLYGFQGFLNSAYFDTEEELIDWVKNNNTKFGSICIIDYLGEVAGCTDVIRATYKNGDSNLYVACDYDGYGIYNSERSIYKGEFVWEYNHGSISEMYDAFRTRGIVFTDDIYKKIDESNMKLMTMFKDNKQKLLTKKKTTDIDNK